MSNSIQDDYVRYPKSTRGSPAMVKLWQKAAARGIYDYTRFEVFWAALQPYLLSRGYRLRPRYQPGWKPIWIGTDIDPDIFEDSVALHLPFIIDARRVEDDKLVAIKWIEAAEDTKDELDIMRFLSSEELRTDPANHCNPLLDSFGHPDDPNGVFIVTPLLSSVNLTPPEMVSDLVDMMLQLFEGLAFMHKHRVAHRDCSGLNIMQDSRSLYPGQRAHPIESDRSEDLQRYLRPIPRCLASVRYYFIDFGVSSRHEGPGPHLVTGVIARDQAAPELSTTVPYDPFKLDIFHLGNHFLERFVDKHKNLDFLRPLLLEMTRPNPNDRPTAQQALDKLKLVALEPIGPIFRWRMRPKDEIFVEILFHDIWSLGIELFLQARHLITGGNELVFGRPT